MPRCGPNQKAVASKEKKAAVQAAKDAEAARRAEATTAADWAEGSNLRGARRSMVAANKADEAARRRREKAAFLAAEEQAAGPGKVIKAKFGAASKKKGTTKNKNDLSLLEDALVGDADKKLKEKKRMERAKRERASAAERQRKAREEKTIKDPLMVNTDTILGVSKEGMGRSIGRAANMENMTELHASGLDSALSALCVGAEGRGDGRHTEKRMKAAYKAYEEEKMPEMKAQYPGLKRQQYLHKIFTLWKKSPENPMNQQLG